MSTFGDVRADYLGKLRGAGITTATLDPVALVPFVLVDAISGPGVGLGVGAWAGELPIRVVVPGPGDAAALEALEIALEAVLATLGAAPFRLELYGPKQLPAYTVTYPVAVPNPTC